MGVFSKWRSGYRVSSLPTNHLRIVHLYGEWRVERRNQHVGLGACIQFLLGEQFRPEEMSH